MVMKLFALSAFVLTVCFQPPAAAAQASWSGTVTLNFDSIAGTGCIDATSYLGRFGVTVTQQSSGTIVSSGGAGQCFHGDVLVPSSPKALYVLNNQPVSFTLNFDRALSRVSFIRARLNAGSSGVNTVGWSATAYSATGAKVTQVGEGAGSAYSPNFIAAAPFTLSGDGIRSVAFVRTDPSGQNTSFGVSFPVLDDFMLTESVAAPAQTDTSLSLDEALCTVAYKGTIEQVKAALSKPVRFNHVCKGWGATSLEIAVLNDRAAVVGAMLEAGATPKSTAKPSTPILHMLHGEASAKLLLNAGAEVDARDAGGDTALCSIASSRMVDGGDTAPGTSGRIAEALLAGKANINATCAEGATPLIQAAHGGNLWVLRVLLSRGADVTRVDSMRRSALLWADHYATGQGSALVGLLDKAEPAERKAIAAALRAAGATR